VFLDLGQGRFKPQEVRVGLQANGMYEVLGGLHAGDVVATSGVFLIAAEARISTAAKYWDDEGGASEPPRVDTAVPPMPAESAPPIPARPPRPAPKASPAQEVAPVYTCPMHPEVRSPVPGKCPKCGMDLVRVPGGAPQ
jgi:hypothetical protein